MRSAAGRRAAGPAAPTGPGQGAVAASRVQRLTADEFTDPKLVRQLGRLFARIDDQVSRTIEHGANERPYFLRVPFPRIDDAAAGVVKPTRERYIPITSPVQTDLVVIARTQLRPEPITPRPPKGAGQSRADLEAAIVHRPGGLRACRRSVRWGAARLRAPPAGANKSKVLMRISQTMPEPAQALTCVCADDSREMTLIDESKIGRHDGEVVMPVGQTLERDRDADSVPELREGHPSNSGKDAADVKSRVSERLSELPKVHVCRVRDHRLASVLYDAMVVASSCGAAGGEASRDGAFRKRTDKPSQPLIELETINASL